MYWTVKHEAYAFLKLADDNILKEIENELRELRKNARDNEEGQFACNMLLDMIYEEQRKRRKMGSVNG